jgi:undecaprenyl-diphosphatase
VCDLRRRTIPCLWFKGGSNYSFPSAEASSPPALVTPYILEYGREYPLTYALLLVPLYVGEGRIKNRQHMAERRAGRMAVGGLSGWFAHSRDVPILIQILPNDLPSVCTSSSDGVDHAEA